MEAWVQIKDEKSINDILGIETTDRYYSYKYSNHWYNAMKLGVNMCVLALKRLSRRDKIVVKRLRLVFRSASRSLVLALKSSTYGTY